MKHQNVYLQHSPPVEDTLCMTFLAKSLIESWCQTQLNGYTNFDCSLSQSHFPETALALKHQEYSYRLRNDCLCWLFLVTTYIIRDWLPQVTELPFCTDIELRRCTAPSTVFSQPCNKRTIIWGPYCGFKSKRLFRKKSDAQEHW